ncbi:MAG: type II toxin-antitoxin system VapC family toxin [Holophaga sp.]
MKFLLDTDTCIFTLRHHPAVRARLQAYGPDAVGISAMNEAELWYGALNSQYPEKHLKDVRAFLEPFLVFPFDREAAQEHARLRMALKNQPIGERDLVIASVALAHRLAVVTHNQREFGRVPGLETVDWVA